MKYQQNQQDEKSNSFEHQNKQKQEQINILLVSDIHMDFDILEKLKSWHNDNKSLQFSYIFCLGDFDNLMQKSKEVDLEICVPSEEQIIKILNCLEYFECPIFYIPGNHDPYSLFKPTIINNKDKLQKNTSFSYNIHNKSYQLKEGLMLLGLGGSVPAYQKLKDNSLSQIWEGYPYQQEEEFANSIQQLITKNLQLIQKNQVVLLTHIGPHLSSTTIVQQTNEQIFSGSIELNNQIQQFQQNILINIHGHTHDSFGMTQLYGIPIINPGSLKYGHNFGILTIIRNQIDKRWLIKSVNFINLNSYI